MTIASVRTHWSGTTGGPGLTQLFIQDQNTFGELTQAQAQAAVNAVRTFWDGVKVYLPDEVSLLVSPTVDQYSVPDGELTYSTTAATAPLIVTGSSAAQYAMAAGIKVNLITGVIRNGRRVRGGLYIVPASLAVFTANGLVGGPARTAINTAGATMLSSLASAGLALVVFSRPIPADKPKGPRTGDVAKVSAIETNEKGAILRGRRD